VEQTISRFLPNILTLKALQAAGISDPEMEAQLDEQVGTALQRLYNWQNPDGGWGWWSKPGEQCADQRLRGVGAGGRRRKPLYRQRDGAEDALNYLEANIKFRQRACRRPVS